MDLLLLLLLMSHPVSGRLACPPKYKHQDGNYPQSFYHPGDHLLGVVIRGSEILHTKLLFNLAPSLQFFFPDSDASGFSYGLQLFFAIQMVNKNFLLLRNLTLGYNIHHNYWSTFHTSDALLDMLSTGDTNVPNYSCGRKDNLLALFHEVNRDITIQMSTLGGTYKIPQK